jgi:hypothetical protein
MAAGPFDPQLVVARLTANVVGDGQGAAQQYRIADFAANQATAIEQRSIALPAALVMEPSYTTIGNSDSSMYVNAQQQYEIGVLTLVQNYGGTPGTLQSQDAGKLRKLLWDYLLGWAPEDSGFVLDSGRGQLLNFDDDFYMYVDIFTLRRVVRQQPKP